MRSQGERRRPQFATRRLARFVGGAGLIALTVFWLLPYLWMILVALRDPSETFVSSILPRRVVLSNFASVAAQPLTTAAFVNSLKVSCGAAALVLILALLAGYGFSRFRFRGHSSMLAFLLVARMFPAVLLAIAFLLIFARIGLYDNLFALVLVNTVLNLPFAIWIMRSVIDSVPSSLEEAALIDGCSRLGAIFRVVVPVIKPGLVATGIYGFLMSWNEYLFATNLIISREKKLVTTLIAEHITQFTTNFTGLLATAVLATLPLVVLFMFIQRFIIAGLAAASVKE